MNSWAGSSDSELEFWAQKVFGSGLKITLTHIVRPEEQTPNKLNTRPSWMDIISRLLDGRNSEKQNHTRGGGGTKFAATTKPSD